MNLNRDSLRIPRSAARCGGLLLGALVSTLVLASPAHAEANFRICGVMSFNNKTPYYNVAFVTKVQKDDKAGCNSAINLAESRFNAVGGALNIQGANRVWRRVRGGGSGPFNGKVLEKNILISNTCERFSWWSTRAEFSAEDLCFKMASYKLYVTASRLSDPVLRAE